MACQTLASKLSLSSEYPPRLSQRKFWKSPPVQCTVILNFYRLPDVVVQAFNPSSPRGRGRRISRELWPAWSTQRTRATQRSGLKTNNNPAHGHALVVRKGMRFIMRTLGFVSRVRWSGCAGRGPCRPASRLSLRRLRFSNLQND